MKKILFLLLLVTQFCFATKINVTNPGNGNDIRANLVTAIATAIDGDSVIIPSCSVPVTTPTILVTKKIKIFGTDSLNTILYRSVSSDASLLNVAIITIDGSSWNLSPSGVKVQGITFKSKVPSVDDAGADGKSIALDQGLKFINVPGFEVKGCNFMFFGNGGIETHHRDHFARGLIHNCSFWWNAKGATGLGFGYAVVTYGEDLQWMSYVDPSSANFIFIEDNVFRFQSHAIAGGGCGLYVSRYNKIYNNIIAANVSKHGFDAHGQRGDGGALAGANYFSTRMAISYHDTLINTLFFDRTTYVSNGTQPVSKPMERGINIRGGEAIIHDDYILGYRFGVGIALDGGAWSYPYLFGEGYASGLTYPSTHTGSTFSQGAGDVFIWNISYIVFDGSDFDGVSFHNYNTSDFLVNRDYHQSDNSSQAKVNYVDYPYPHPGF